MKRLTLLFLLCMTVLLPALVQSQDGPAVVSYKGIGLFEVYADNEVLDRHERAVVITARLKSYAVDGKLEPDSFQILQRDSSFYIEYAHQRVFKVRHGDAVAMDMSKAEAAEQYLDEITKKLEGRNTVDFVKDMAINVVLALLVIFLLYFVIRYMNKLFMYLNIRLIRSNSEFLGGVTFRNYEFLSKDRLLSLLSNALNVLKWVVILLLVYIALPILFSIFPGTEGIARSLFALVLNPVQNILSGLAGYLPNLITIAVIAVAVRYAVRFIHFLADEVRTEKLVIPGFYADWAYPTYQILRFIFIAFGFIMIFPYLPGSDSPIFQGVSVFLGLLVSFGSGSAISNAVAGIVITYMRPYKMGDRVKIGDVTGEVIEKSMLVTRVRTIKNEDVTIPNSTILTNHTVNYSTIAKDDGVILYTTVTIGYDVPWKQVHELLIAAGKGAAMVEESPSPFVLQTGLEDFYVSYQLNCYTKYPEKAALVYSNLHANIQDKFNEAGVEIMSPHYRAARDGNMVTIPASYLPKDDKAPTLGIKMDKDD